MQLKKIKLSGFKSFVDPTVVLVPSKLVAVVGPNGCGKSNIIDAVCWVMGESSAKYLRGESSTDVIFNGSSVRKPVGLASVELIFDNQDGGLGGEYTAYAEISIRRQITREGDSGYFLNGTRCRRKDIIDIFLGTGLGPRSYSIIGQNMISRIIEAKPDDMRVYLEEAAGVSKYKERRRETENRINHTKENLARLTDVRLELEKQLGSLKRQANAAEKFKLLKQEERTLRAQWLVIQWRKIDARLVQSSLQIQQQETGLEARNAEISEINIKLEAKQELQHTFAESFQDVQRQYYATGNEITRIEQDIRHTEERQNQWKADIAQTNYDWTQTQTLHEEGQLELENLSEAILLIEPQLHVITQASKMANEAVTDAEQEMQQWQSQWDAFNQSVAKSTQTAQVEQTRMQHLEQRIASINQRQQKLTDEQEQINFSQLEATLVGLSTEESDVLLQTQNHIQHIATLREHIATAQTSYQQYTQQLDQIRNQLQRLNGQQAWLLIEKN